FLGIDFNPDIIETNYLWPFCSVAEYVANKYNKPLLIRPAVSDILKFNNDPEFKKIIKMYFNNADRIVTNSYIDKFIREIYNENKITVLDRYVPDPDIFYYDDKCDKKYDILFPGKINYYWNLKGIELLLNLIKRNNFKSLFLINGNNLEDIENLIIKRGLSNNIELKKFVPPDKMPKYINQSKTVWCWDEDSTIDDFSNIILEACFCNVSCLVNSKRKENKELKTLIKLFPGLIKLVNLDDLKRTELLNSTNNLPGDVISELKKIYNNYISQNIELYNAIE
ncbi:unnamed protein product, partial [marine sediment metagenome]